MTDGNSDSTAKHGRPARAAEGALHARRGFEFGDLSYRHDVGRDIRVSLLLMFIHANDGQGVHICISKQFTSHGESCSHF